MKTCLLTVCLCLLAVRALTAGAGPVEVSPLGADTLQTQPRQIVTGAFLLKNTTSRTIEIVSDVVVPADWDLVTRDIPSRLRPNEQDIGLITLMVPRAARPGTYRIVHLVGTRDDPSIMDSTAIEVMVEALARLELEVLNAPEYVVAGETYSATFAAINRGNTPVDLHLRADTNARLAYKLSAQRMHLPPGESEIVTISIETPTSLRRILRDRVVLLAEAVEPVKVKARATQPMEVIPRISGIDDRFHRIPMQLVMREMWEQNGDRTSRFQGELFGEGTLDEQGTRNVAFVARGPDSRHVGTLGRRDEYSFTHWTDDYEIAVGDHGFSVSPLTENFLYGTGVRGKLKVNKLGIGAHYMENHDEELFQRQTAAYLAYEIGERGSARLSYLDKTHDYRSDMAGLDLELQTSENSNLEMEYARGLDGRKLCNAYRLKFSVRTDRISFFHRFMHADPDYLGYVTDMNFMATALGFDLGHGFRLDGSFRGERRNFDLDPSKMSAPTDQSYDVRLGYRVDLVADLSVAFKKRVYEDPLLDTPIHLNEDAVRIAMGRRFQGWSIHASVEPGRSEDRLTNTFSRFQRYAAALRVNPSPRHSYQCYFNYDNAVRPEQIDRRNVTAGLKAAVRLTSNTRFDLGFRLEDPRAPEDRDRDIFEMGFNHRLSSRHAVQARAQYTTNRGDETPDEIAFTVEYRMGFGMPASRKQGMGLLRGRVYDEKTGKPLRDVIIRLSGITAVTDRGGDFVFPAVTAGTHHLDVDRASIGIGRISRQRTPAEIYIEGGATASIDLVIVQAAAVSGEVVLFGYEDDRTVLPPDGFTGELIRDRGLPNMLIELTDGSESRRVISEPDGSFRFDEVRPGTWTLKIHEGTLPEHTYLEQTAFEFELLPGDEKGFLVRVVPTLRPIEMLEQGGTIRQRDTQR